MSLGSFFHESKNHPGVVVVGALGMLGVEVCSLLTRLNIPFTAVDRYDFDLTSPGAVAASTLDMSRVWINCAAWTNVDDAEEHETKALAINGGAGLQALCARLEEAGGVLIHISTDYVFDGNATEPYQTDRERLPIGAYGRTKAAGEIVIEESGCEFIIARTSWLYSHRANNFVRTMAKLTRDKDQLKVVSDQRGRPTSALHLAESLLKLADANARGIFHVTDNGECSWFEFTLAIRDRLNHKCNIEPCTTDEFPRPAQRPAYSVLDLSKTEALIGKMPNWQQNLANVLKTLEPY